HILREAAEAEGLPYMDQALLVSQTTATQPAWEALQKALIPRIPGLSAVKTICEATTKRQDAARELAGRADAVLVVGDRRSANTQKLLAICVERCPRTLLIEGGQDIPEGFLRPKDTVGITAGASTPDWSLKEVVTRMNDMEKQEQGLDQAQQDFMADVEATLVRIRPGQTITGTVVQITEDEVCVNIGYKSDGLITRADLTSTDCQIGDEIEVEVVKVNDGEGNVVLSQRNIVNRKIWDALLDMFESGDFVDGIGKDAVKGGLIADVMGVRAFIPASQLSQRYVERIEDFVGQELKLKIIEVDKVKKRIVASHKAYLAAESALRKKEIWGTLVEGEVVRGVVRRLTDFGAFVDIGGVDGLVHVTDLSWGRVRHPSDVVSPNQEIDVVLLSLDPERERIQLGYKQLQKRPWEAAEENYPVGSIVEGKVVRITTFGAFVELEPGLDGLVHISQCALKRVPKVEDAVQVGAIVRVKVLGVDMAAKRISLSIREALEEEAFLYPDEIPEFADEITPEPVAEEPVAEEPAAEAPVVEESAADVSVEVAEEIQPELKPVAEAAIEAEPVDAPAKPKRAPRKKKEEVPAEGEAAEPAEPKKPRTRKKAAPAEEAEAVEATEPAKDAE
ncbi:MAG: 30S ribosomal protein S1, partial [Clostridia bacterium]|nr:30S ribosomal protein S1 [Clostridia bacterium]